MLKLLKETCTSRSHKAYIKNIPSHGTRAKKIYNTVVPILFGTMSRIFFRYIRIPDTITFLGESLPNLALAYSIKRLAETHAAKFLYLSSDFTSVEVEFSVCESHELISTHLESSVKYKY